jgi:hypothetical protein
MAAEKVLPSDTKIDFLVGDNTRQEIGGKLTIIGYFAGAEIQIDPKVSLPVVFPLGFVFVIKDGFGTFKTEVEFIDPTGKSSSRNPMDDTPKRVGKHHTLTVNLMNFLVDATGIHKIVLILDGVRYVREFNITRRDA